MTLSAYHTELGPKESETINLLEIIRERGSHLISSFVAYDDEHRSVLRLDAILDHHTDAIINLFLHHI